MHTRVKKRTAAAPEGANDNNIPKAAENGNLGSADNCLATTFAPVITMRPVRDIKPNPRNARTHSAKQIQQLHAAIAKMGFIVPVIVDEGGNVLAGHGRLAAAKQANMTDIPTIQVDHLTPELKRAFALADNRLAELAGWDEAVLAEELLDLSSADLTFDFEVTGFNTCDLDRITSRTPVSDVAEVVPELERDQEPISAIGDLWKLGPHLIFCGSALDSAAYKSLMPDQRAQMVFTDPPYNVEVDGHVCGLGSVKHRPFPMASGEMNPAQFEAFLKTAMTLMVDHSADGSIHYICMDWRHIGELLAASESLYGAWKNLCVWNKSNAGMGTFYRSKHELVFVFKVGSAPHINNFGLGEKGRYRTNVWDYPGVNTFKRDRLKELSIHPTVKPLAMVEDAIKDCSTRGGLVLDPFLGSGTTLLAAERTGRVCRAMELDPHYVDAALRRWQDLTTKSAVHASTGKTFNETAAAASSR